MIVRTNSIKLPKIIVSIKGEKEPLKGKLTKDGHLEYTLPGNQQITVIGSHSHLV